MYPRLSDIFQDLFGFSLPIPIYSFGFMVAMAAMTAAWLLQKEFDRMYQAGQLSGVKIDDPTAKKGRAKQVVASPSFIVGTFTMLAIFSGFAGAKVFHILENLGTFFAAPLQMIFSTGGFTFYGGLVVAGVVIARYVKKKGLNLASVADANAPGLMLAYGIGRIGCHLSGDGDWGIAADVAAKPSWLPTWLWAEDYANNILRIDLSAAPVYPTPIYEFVAASVLFLMLWRLRNHNHRKGWLFWVYLFAGGVERLLIEQIRVNNEFDVFGITATQAEVLAVVFIVAGAIGMWRCWRPAEAGVPT